MAKWRACWRRLQRLNSAGIILGTTSQIDLSALGIDLTIFVMVQNTASHERVGGKIWEVRRATARSDRFSSHRW